MKQPPKTFLTSDTHFFHSRVSDFCQRPHNWQERIIKQWKHFVKDTDIIIHLGDVIFSNKASLIEIMSQLPGTKILVKGNHDRLSNTAYREAGFFIVVHSLVYEMSVSRQKSYVILSHKPTPLTLGDNWYNIHGHFHNCSQTNWEPELKKRLTDKHYLFTLENLNYRPILLADAIDKNILPKTVTCGVNNEL
jgi:calcineurin-like phosphoesterase family protein